MLTVCNSAESPVEITSPLKNVDALEKDTITFSCELSKPNITTGKWTFNGEEISTNIAVDGDTHSLTIKTVAVEHQGQYSFSVGHATTEGTLFVGGTQRCHVGLDSLLHGWLLAQSGCL